MEANLKGIVIGGVSSDSGKTTLTIGLIQLLRKRGFDVSVFKAGPDYIDPMFHKSVLKKPAYNLVPWLMEKEVIQYLFGKRSSESDFTVIEGVMGYFDGHSSENTIGSTSDLAQILQVPSLIVMNAGKMALTAAAIVKGIADFESPRMLKGVIFNKVNSDSHYRLLKDAIETHTPLKCYGYMPNIPTAHIESRHLGLMQANEIHDLEMKIETIANKLEETIEVDALIRDYDIQKNVGCFEPVMDQLESLKKKISAIGGLTIGVAYDNAFSFYYEENLRTLSEIGVKIVTFSPLKDNKIPPCCDGLYIGGGYPEVFAKELHENLTFRASLMKALNEGMPTYAECGGLMYLGQNIGTLKGETYDMVGFLEGYSMMTEKLQRFGHVECQLTYRGQMVAYRGHEFHKSVFEADTGLKRIIKVKKKKNEWTCGYHKKNVIATYAHNHFYSNLEFLDILISLWTSQKNEFSLEFFE